MIRNSDNKATDDCKFNHKKLYLSIFHVW